VRDHAVIGLWHFSQRNRKRNKVSFTLDLIMPDDTPRLKNAEGGCVAQQRTIPSLTKYPITKDFSTTGTNDFSVSSGYAAQFARGIWN
jgi:hypothetical protein